MPINSLKLLFGICKPIVQAVKIKEMKRYSRG